MKGSKSDEINYLSHKGIPVDPLQQLACVYDFTILSASDISYWTGTNGISPDNLLTFKGW